MRGRSNWLCGLSLIVVALLCGTVRITGITLPSGFSESLVASGLAQPTAMAIAPDGRIFVTEQQGTVRVIKNGVLLSEPFVSLAVNNYGERGLLGVALDPQFSLNQYVYLYYTALTPNVHNRVSRFTASGDEALPGSEVVIFDLDPLSSSGIHNAGAIHFGTDGDLYIAVGENFDSAAAQSLQNAFGKLLRIHPDGSIPTDNPFFNTASGKGRAIWSMGLRNPFTFAVQPGTGRIYINDVGDSHWEEINEAAPGANFGWPLTEGPTTNPQFESPAFAYMHGTGTSNGCAVVGGTFYNPAVAQFPSTYVGKYFFADYCNGWIRRIDPLNPTSATVFATGLKFAVDLDVSSDGSLYYLMRGTSPTAGLIRRIQFGPRPPSITTQPVSQIVQPGTLVAFSVGASGSTPLTYQWQRNGLDIPGATAATYQLGAAQLSDNGAVFRAVVRNALGTVTSSGAVLTVTTNNFPTASIVTPASGAKYAAGATIVFSGTASDPEDGTLPPGRFTWWVEFAHSTHVHPFLPPASGFTGGSFVIPNVGETATDVRYRIFLSVVDSGGLVRTVSRDIVPLVRTLTFGTSPQFLELRIDGQPVSFINDIGMNQAVAIKSVQGMIRSLSAISPQFQDGATWVFDSWSDRGAQNHTITTPSANTEYTAIFRVNGGAVGTGTGLSAVYYNGLNFTSSTASRIDDTINFNWGTAKPHPSIANSSYSVRWTGRVQPQFSQTYTFYTQTDDGVRLFVNGQQLINDWTDHLLAENSGTIALTAGQTYTISMEYYDNSGPAAAKLLWSSNSTPKSVIPRSQLYP